MRFTAFHSAARISLQPKVCRGKFPISNAIKSSSGAVNLQCVCENHPSLERKACKRLRLTTSLLAQHYETLLRDGLRCRCLIITSNSNSVFSSRASCQNQAHQLEPPQYRDCNGLPVTFALLGLFCAVCFVLFCGFFDGTTVYFCHSMSRASLRLLVNLLISATCNERVERPGESQEASTEKTLGTRGYLVSNCRLPEVGT